MSDCKPATLQSQSFITESSLYPLYIKKTAPEIYNNMSTSAFTFLLCFIILVIWSIWLAKKWVQRLDDDGTPNSNHTANKSYIFPAILIFCISSIVLPFLIILPKSLFNLIHKPSYQATIVDYSSEMETTRDQNNRSRDVLMHRAFVSFTDQHGHDIKKIKVNISSSEVPIIGDKIKVVYEDGDQTVDELSIRSYLLLFAGFFMSFFMLLILYTIVAYALKFNLQSLRKFWIFFIFRFTLPLAVTGMFACFAYVIFEYFFLGNPQSLPIWAVIICTIFALVLLPLIFYFFKPQQDTE